MANETALEVVAGQAIVDLDAALADELQARRSADDVIDLRDSVALVTRRQRATSGGAFERPSLAFSAGTFRVADAAVWQGQLEPVRRRLERAAKAVGRIGLAGRQVRRRTR